MKGTLDGKVAVVVGAGRQRGQGQAAALSLARAGADVAVCDLGRPRPELGSGASSPVAEDTAVLDSLVAELESIGRRGLAVSMDVTSSEEVEVGIGRIVDRLGGVDVLFNAVGTNHGSAPTLESEERFWDLQWQVNVMGPMRVSRAALPSMRERGGGSIVNTSSMAGSRAYAGLGPYVATKAALIAMSKAMALELGEDGIRVNVICPGEIETQMWERSLEGDWVEAAGMTRESAVAEMAAGTALRRIGTPEDIADVVCWLASPQSAFVTGEAITVSGGLSGGL